MLSPAQNPLLKEALAAIANTKDDTTGASVQYSDIILKTTALYVITVISAAIGWLYLPTVAALPLVFGALGVAIAAIVRKQVGFSLPVLYAVLQGGAVGIISELFAQQYGSDIVTTAVIATAVVFAICLAVFQIPAVRNGSQGRKIFFVAIISYLVLSVISLIAGAFFGVGDGWGFYGLGWLGIAIAVGATILSAWSLVIDFGDADKAVKNQYPESFSWTLSLGLLISTIWVYLNILRLLALLRR